MNNNFTQLQKHYKNWLATLGFSHSIIYSYPQILYYFFVYLESKGINHIKQLKSQEVTAYFTYLQSRKNMRNKNKTLSKAHLNKSFEAIDKFLQFLHQSDLKTAPQPVNYRITESKNEIEQKIKTLSKKEIQLLYDSTPKLFTHLSREKAEPRQALARLILDLCYGCGLRKSEAYNLLVEDIDLDKKILFVRQAKGYKDRFVPMRKTVLQRSELFIYQYRRAFNSKQKRLFPLSKHSLPYYLKQMQKASGIKKSFGLHILRHSIATHLLQNGMNIEQIAHFLGHATLESTQVYTHLIQANAQ